MQHKIFKCQLPIAQEFSPLQFTCFCRAHLRWAGHACSCHNDSSVYVRAFLCLNFSRPCTSTVVDIFQKNLRQLFSVMGRYASRNICSGNFCLDHNSYNFGWILIHLTQVISSWSRSAIWNFHSGRSKVKVMLARQVVQSVILSKHVPTSGNFLFWNSSYSFVAIVLKICTNIGHIVKLCNIQFFTVRSCCFKNCLPLNLAIFSKDIYDFVSWTHRLVLSHILWQVLVSVILA